MPDLSEFSASDTPLNAGGFEEMVGINPRDALRFAYCYWRKPNGWICAAPYFGDDLRAQIERGMVPLTQYGKFPRKTASWDTFLDEFRQIFRAGGAHEFPLDQILQNGWHRKPPFPGVTFPQLQGVEIVEYECAICKKKYLSEHNLASHQSIAHKETSHENALGRAIGKAIEEAQAGNNNGMAQALMALAEQFAKQNEQMADALAKLAKK